jgi:diguanylate cyclase (GGDEF)-like protein
MSTRTVAVPAELEQLFSQTEKRVAEFFSNHHWDPTRGIIEIAGSRYILLRSAALSVEFFQLIRSFYGSEHKQDADRFTANSLYDLGHSLGKGDARAYRSRLSPNQPDDNRADILAAGAIHSSHNGWAFVDILAGSSPTPDENFVLYYQHKQSFESDAWLQTDEHSDYPVCVMNAGYSAGWSEESFGITLEAREISCRGCGGTDCVFVMAPPHQLDKRIEELLSTHPQIKAHYKASNISNKADSSQLNPELKATLESSNELLYHARKLGSVQDELQKKVEELQAEITERRKVEHELMQLSSYDTLTGLANRKLFEDTVTRALSAHKRLNQAGAVMFIDLDHFRKVNESLGHSVGDELLVEVARRIQSVLAPENSLARLGGDEFSLWFENINNLHSIAKVARTIIAVLDNPIFVHQQEIVVTPSIGIALYPLDGDSIELLMRNAHTAMYHAKQLGRNNFQFFARPMNERAKHRLNLETMLRQAIERNEISIHYQPKIDLETSSVTGIEALARWQNADKAYISPVDFIPLAEETGMIIPLGQYILEKCCHFIRRLLDANIEFGRVAINLSPRQFRHENLAGNIAATLAKNEIPPQFIELEITESALIEDPEQAIELLQNIKSLGIHLAIDDFGTGYSSLSYLQMYPLDTLKIDRSFIIGLLKGKRSLPASIVNLAHNLGLNVVAEGVEEVEQLYELKAMQCNEIQGFLFGKPMSEDALIEFLSTRENKPMFA